jgi:hypothetical protein
MWMQDLPFDHEDPHDERRVRHVAVAFLRLASELLDSLASKLDWRPSAAGQAEPVLEFHADAGAPEGALFVNGELVGHVLGVTRL